MINQLQFDNFDAKIIEINFLANYLLFFCSYIMAFIYRVDLQLFLS